MLKEHIAEIYLDCYLLGFLTEYFDLSKKESKRIIKNFILDNCKELDNSSHKKNLLTVAHSNDPQKLLDVTWGVLEKEFDKLT